MGRVLSCDLDRRNVGGGWFKDEIGNVGAAGHAEDFCRLL